MFVVRHRLSIACSWDMSFFLKCLFTCLFSVCSNSVPELHLPAGTYMLNSLVDGELYTIGVAVPYSMNNGWSQQHIVCATQSKFLVCLFILKKILCYHAHINFSINPHILNVPILFRF